MAIKTSATKKAEIQAVFSMLHYAKVAMRNADADTDTMQLFCNEIELAERTAKEYKTKLNEQKDL